MDAISIMTKMKLRANKILVTFLLIPISSAFAYETPTHAAITAAAVAQSKLTASPETSDVLSKLGITSLDWDKPFLRRYIALAAAPEAFALAAQV